MDARDIKKNLLDLEYSKYLQYYNSTLVVLFTFMIGLMIALITQSSVLTPVRIILILGLSVIFLSFSIIMLLSFSRKLKLVVSKIKRLVQH